MSAPVAATASLPRHLPAAAIRLLPLQPRPQLVVRRRRALLRCAAVSELAPVASAVYGALLLGCGAFAYARSGSKGSIYGGLSGSVLMGAAYYLMQSAETKATGDAVGFGSAFLFACVFGIRLYNSRKLVPSGLLLVLSLGAWVSFILLTCKTRFEPTRSVHQLQNFVLTEGSLKISSIK